MKMKLNRWLILSALIIGIQTLAYAQSTSSMKWADICSGKMNEEWYGSEEAKQIADVVLSVQKYNGGLMKLPVSKTKDGNIYNLQGIRQSNPIKGLYISNGKKIIIK